MNNLQSTKFLGMNNHSRNEKPIEQMNLWLINKSFQRIVLTVLSWLKASQTFCTANQQENAISSVQIASFQRLFWATWLFCIANQWATTHKKLPLWSWGLNVVPTCWLVVSSPTCDADEWHKGDTLLPSINMVVFGRTWKLRFLLCTIWLTSVWWLNHLLTCNWCCLMLSCLNFRAAEPDGLDVTFVRIKRVIYQNSFLFDTNNVLHKLTHWPARLNNNWDSQTTMQSKSLQDVHRCKLTNLLSWFSFFGMQIQLNLFTDLNWQKS